MGSEVGLPSNFEELSRVMKGYLTAESHLNGVRFKPSPTDVIISTAPKSGTTWVQQICHGLRSGGDMSFEEISLVVPCLEMAGDYEYGDLQAAQPFEPRVYKTHLWYHACPKGAAKYIVIARQPSDAALSYYHFLANWIFAAEKISAEQLIESVYLNYGAPKTETEDASQFHHIISWYPHRKDENVLWLHYEDLKQDLCECVRLIAEFLNIGNNDEELQKLVTYQASYEFMKKHSGQFDEHQMKLARNEKAGLPRNAGLIGNCGKVRSGQVNASKDILPKHILDKIDQKWKEIVTSETGYETYEALRHGINKELQRKFV